MSIKFNKFHIGNKVKTKPEYKKRFDEEVIGIVIGKSTLGNDIYNISSGGKVYEIHSDWLLLNERG